MKSGFLSDIWLFMTQHLKHAKTIPCSFHEISIGIDVNCRPSNGMHKSLESGKYCLNLSSSSVNFLCYVIESMELNLSDSHKENVSFSHWEYQLDILEYLEY